MVARDGLEPPTPGLFRLALIRVYNDLTGLSWLPKAFESRERRVILGWNLGLAASSIGGEGEKLLMTNDPVDYEPTTISSFNLKDAGGPRKPL